MHHRRNTHPSIKVITLQLKYFFSLKVLFSKQLFSQYPLLLSLSTFFSRTTFLFPPIQFPRCTRTRQFNYQTTLPNKHFSQIFVIKVAIGSIQSPNSRSYLHKVLELINTLATAKSCEIISIRVRVSCKSSWNHFQETRRSIPPCDSSILH